MAMTLRLPEDLDQALRAAAAEDHRSVQQEVTHALETYLAWRETEEIKADPETLRALAEARDSVRSGDVVFGGRPVTDVVPHRRGTGRRRFVPVAELAEAFAATPVGDPVAWRDDMAAADEVFAPDEPADPFERERH